MSRLNLDGMSIEGLKELRRDVVKAIEHYEDCRRKEAISALEEKASEMGFALAELTGSGFRSRNRNPKNAPKYVHPENSWMTWSGRGRQPDWLREAIAAGRAKEDFLVGNGSIGPD